MSKKKFPVTEAEVKKHETAGKADITVTVDDVSHSFPAIKFSGYLSWTGIDGEWPTSIRIDYGSNLAVGTHTFDFEVSQKMLSYADAQGNRRHWPTSGKVEVIVQRPEFGDEFKHVGTLVDVKYGDQSPVITLNGTYEVGEYEPD